MHLVEPNHALEGFGLCFICNGAIDRDHQLVVDTNYEFDPPYPDPLVGRKYICQQCGETIGHTLGMVTHQNVSDIQTALANTKAALQEYTDTIKVLAGSLEGEASKVLDLPVLDLPDIGVTIDGKAVKAVTDQPKADTKTKEKKSGS